MTPQLAVENRKSTAHPRNDSSLSTVRKTLSEGVLGDSREPGVEMKLWPEEESTCSREVLLVSVLSLQDLLSEVHEPRAEASEGNPSDEYEAILEVDAFRRLFEPIPNGVKVLPAQ